MEIRDELRDKTRKEMIACTDVIILVILLFDLVFFAVRRSDGMVGDASARYYLLFTIAVPTAIHVLMSFCIHLTEHIRRIGEMAKGIIIVSCIAVIAESALVIHYQYVPVMCIFSAVIVSAALIGNKRLIVYAYALSVVLVFAAVPLADFRTQLDSTLLLLEYTALSAVLMLMVAVLSGVILGDKMRSMDQLEEYADSLQNAIFDSKTDSMTGLYNHREYYKILDQSKERADFLVTAVLDIDHFKQVNDIYGHDNGDKVIVSIANICERMSNNRNIFAFRYGGEEFTFIFTDMEEEEVGIYIEDVRRQVRAIRFDFDKKKVVTLSAGLFGCDPQQVKSENIFANADKALYYAKEHGRDQLHFYTEKDALSPELSPRTNG